MAEKRMFAKSIVLSDAFLDMPMSARCLYFTLGMLADDDGFVDGPKSIMRQCGASQDDLAILVGKRFVLLFESGVIVIKHWRINNYLRSDRYTPTNHIKEKSALAVDSNGAYTENDQPLLPIKSETSAFSGIPCGIPSIDKSREEKGRIGESSNSSISDEMDCSTDVQRVVTAWNAIDGLPKITRLDPDSNRGKMLGARIKAYGIDKVLGAIESIPHSSFLMGKTKKQFRLTFDWFVKPNNFPKVLEGNYLDENKAAYAKDSDPCRGARMLARKLRERLPSLPEYPEETLQKWAAVMDELNRDGHDWDEISDVLSYSQKSAFWQRQICDAYALRKKYVNILADMDKG